MLSIPQLAHRWGVGYATIRKAVYKGQIRAIRLGKACVRIPIGEVHRLEAADSDVSAKGGGGA